MVQLYPDDTLRPFERIDLITNIIFVIATKPDLIIFSKVWKSGPSAALPQPMNSLTTEFAYPMPVEPWMIEGPFTEERFHNSRFDVPHFSLPAGSRLKIDYKGALVGLGIVFGPDTPGVYKAVLNGRTSNLSLFTHYCCKPHLGSIILNKDLSDPDQHGKLTCEAMPVYPDYAHTRKYTPLPVPIPIENLRLNITHLMLLGKALPPDTGA